VYPAIERAPGAIRTGTPEEVREDLNRWHRLLEREIRSRPTQWAWFHRRWRKRPAGEAPASEAPAAVSDRRRSAVRNMDPVPSRPAAISR
jgi:hypothetical protein